MTNTIINSGEELNIQQIASSFQVVHATPGRLRLRTNDISFKPAVKTFAQILQQQEGISEVQINEKTGSLVVTFDKNKLSQTQMIALIQQFGVSQALVAEEKKTDYFAAWKSVDFWKEQGLDFIPLATGLAVTGGLGISGLVAIPVYMITAGATRRAIDLTRDAWLEVKDERLEDKADKEDEVQQQLQSKIPYPKSKIYTAYKIVHAVPGRVRFNVPRLAEDPMYAEQLQTLLKADAAITSFRLNRDAASIVIDYKPSEGTPTSYWIELLQTAEEESRQQNNLATVPTEQKLELEQQPPEEQDSISITLLPQTDEIKAIELSSLWRMMKSPGLNLSLAFMANFPLQTVPE